MAIPRTVYANAKMLSREIIAGLGRRYLPIEVYRNTFRTHKYNSMNAYKKL